MSIYLLPIGDRLTDPACFTPCIERFLTAEQKLLQELAGPFGTIVEACCTKGRYAPAFESKNYIGIYIASHNIQEAEKLHARGTFICEDVSKLPEILENADLRGVSLLIFPFNAFGNLPDGEGMLRMLHKSGLSFVISTYTTDKISSEARAEYYLAAGIENLVYQNTEEGIRFTDDDCFDSIAYKIEWFRKAFAQFGMQCRSIPFSEIGIAYVNF